jgi:type IV pilus assembly protein PilW
MRKANCPALPLRSRGVSLAEVLIALAIAMIISAAMAGLFAQSVKSREQVDREGQRIESGRYALDAIGDDIRLAGFYGDYLPRSGSGNSWPAASTATATWTAPGPCETALANLGWDNSVTGPAATASGTVNVPVAIFGYEGGHATPATLPTALTACLPNYSAGSDVIVTRRVSTIAPAATAPTTAPATTAAMTANDVYLQVSNCSTQSPRFVLSATAADLTMQKLNCSSSAVGPLRKYMVRIYYVASCNTCSPSDGIPTLKVSELAVSGGTRQMVVRALTPGIQDMHVEYGIDENLDGFAGSGSADSFQTSVAAPTITTPFIVTNGPVGIPADKPAVNTPLGWQNVMAVKVWVLARDLDSTTGYTNNRTYVLGGESVGPFNDPVRRNVFASTIRVVNPAGAREMP